MRRSPDHFWYLVFMLLLLLIPATGCEEGEQAGDGDGALKPAMADAAVDDPTGSSADGPGEAPDAAGPSAVVFDRHVIDGDPDRPAFVTSADLDGDGALEIVVSVFADSGPMGSGMVAVYSKPSPVASWSRRVIVPKSAGIRFPNSISAEDIDGDGDLDLFLPYGFLACLPLPCGGLAWLEQTASGAWKKHDVVPKGSELFYHHVEHVDLDGDKIKEIVTVGESKSIFGPGKAVTQIFAGNPSSEDRFDKVPLEVGPGLGSLPTVIDLDGDGDLDIASAQYFAQGASAAWFELTGNGWVKHVIDDQVGPSIQLSLVPELGWILANHTNTLDDATDPESAIYALEPPADPRQKWKRRKISTGIQSRRSPLMGPRGAPGVFHWGDLDGDGDTDLLVSGDGDPKVYWLEQLGPGSFTTHVLASDLPQAGVAAADLDGDGRDEAIVSSYEADQLVVFQSSNGGK
jgi:hypothetical protein